MRGTARLLRGFWGRSVDELKRLTEIARNLEAIKGPSGPYELHSFREPQSIKGCKVMSDADAGGFSRAKLDWVDHQAGSDRLASAGAPATYARFHGYISTQLPEARLEIQRTGYAGWRTLDRPPTLFGRSLWDIDSYAYLAMRIKSDGRSYFVNVQTESIVPTDLHQHRLFSKRPGSWETVLIKWNDFVRTNQGFVVEPQTEMLRQKVRSIGIGLTDRIPGPFQLCVERIWATNNERDMDGELLATEEPGEKEGDLKTRRGRAVTWGP